MKRRYKKKKVQMSGVGFRFGNGDGTNVEVMDEGGNG